MVALSERKGSKIIKIAYIGDSGTGKTGSLVPLVKDGYKLRILDLDNGLDFFQKLVEKECPDKIGNVDYETRRDKVKASPGGPILAGAAKAFTDSLALMTKWSDGTTPAEWGGDTIFVLDSGSAYGRAAYAWAKGMNPTAKDPRQWYFSAQQAFEDTVAMLTDEAFNCNVIFISHVNYKEVIEGVHKGYINTIGTALGPVIPRYFNTLILAEQSGTGKNTRRTIKTLPTPLVDLKNPVSFELPDTLPLETGMSTIFKALRGENA